MFARLKNKVKEEATNDPSASVLSQPRSDRSLKDSSSNVSDGHLSSSDDTATNHRTDKSGAAKPTTESNLTQKSTTTLRPAATESTVSAPVDKKAAPASTAVSHVNSVNGDHHEQALSGAKSDSHDESVKSQLKQLNQSLLNQIESLKVSHRSLLTTRSSLPRLASHLNVMSIGQKNELKQNLNENEDLRIEINKLNSQVSRVQA